MVNPRVIQRQRSLCSLNDNPDVAQRNAVAQTKGMKDKTGGSM
jgi:hypothetical protein